MQSAKWKVQNAKRLLISIDIILCFLRGDDYFFLSIFQNSRGERMATFPYRFITVGTQPSCGKGCNDDICIENDPHDIDKDSPLCTLHFALSTLFGSFIVMTDFAMILANSSPSVKTAWLPTSCGMSCGFSHVQYLGSLHHSDIF